MEIHSYPKVWALGHGACKGILDEPVRVQEKIDGSQFSFMLLDGVVHFRSHNAIVHRESAGMFKVAVDNVLALTDYLTPALTYRGEFVAKPKHNVLAYERVPKGNIILFDINDAQESYVPREEVEEYAARLGFECVPDHGWHTIKSLDDVKHLVDEPSCLGGPREGIVFKQYMKFGRDGHALMAKYVTEKFKETHKREWKEAANIVETIIMALRTPARWQKAVQHLREIGMLKDAPQDIGLLIQSIKADVLVEEREYIQEKLYEHFVGDITRGVVRGAPEWYKEELVKKEFEI